MKKALGALVLGILVVVVLLLMREGAQTRAVAPGYAFDTTQTAAVERLQVAMYDDSVTLVRDAGRWRVLPDSSPADTARVGLALRHLLGLQDKEIVSRTTDPSRLAEFGLDAGERKRVSWQVRGRTVTVYLGHTSGIDFNSTYWRHPERTDVYRTPGNFTHEIGVRPRDWKDQTLSPAPGTSP